MLKTITGEDYLTVRFMFEEEFQLRTQFKLWISTNVVPKIEGTDEGIWRRIRVIPFQCTFSESDRDKKYYTNSLQPELQGILRWAIEGCVKWYNEGLTTPEKVLNFTEEYKIEYDPVERFINDCCTIKADYSVAANELYVRYTLWCKKNIEENILSNVIFSRKIMEKNYIKETIKI